MNTLMILEQLPPKGVKREQAILELGKDEANGELLFQLVNTEKGKCKTAAQKALAQLEYAPAAPLWAKLVKGKWMGSHIMSDACSDCVSEQIAPVILKTLSLLLDEADTKPLEEGQVEQMNFCFHLMLGKASPKMLEVYRFLAENAERIGHLKHTPFYDGDKCTTWHISQGLGLYKVKPKEMEKIPALILTASLIRNPDTRLQALADELYERYGGSWLIPVFMKAIITQPKEQVYAMDKTAVYTTSGRVSDAELAAFQVLDNGQNDSGAPQGYAKDSRQVYFHNGDGKVKVIKGAELSSFRSLGDTYFARDEKRIYAYGKQLPKAELTSWELLGHWYSRDARRVYYLNREIKGADRDSFVVCTPLDAAPLADHLARDKDHFYQNDEMIEETLWLERLHEMTQEP